MPVPHDPQHPIARGMSALRSRQTEDVEMFLLMSLIAGGLVAPFAWVPLRLGASLKAKGRQRRQEEALAHSHSIVPGGLEV
jgi:hypothetical protein